MTVIVTIEAESLLTRTGHAVTSTGTLIPIARLLELATEAQIVPTVLNRSGQC